MRKQILISTALCVLCSGCGFTPMYGSLDNAQTVSAQETLAQIGIKNIPNREGLFLRNALIDSFYKNGRPSDPRFTLKISEISESTYDLDITVTSDATRAQLTLSTAMNLIDNDTGEDVFNRSLKSSASYNIMESEFATRISEKNTRENVLNDLARKIELQIMLYLNRVK